MLLKSEDEGGDLSDFITNGEWYLLGKFQKWSKKASGTKPICVSVRFETSVNCRRRCALHKFLCQQDTNAGFANISMRGLLIRAYLQGCLEQKTQ